MLRALRAGCRRTRRRSRVPAPSSAAASCPEVVAGLLDRPIADLDAPDRGARRRRRSCIPFNFLDRGYYDFRHQLLRDALYGTVQAGELRRLHARAGEFGGAPRRRVRGPRVAPLRACRAPGPGLSRRRCAGARGGRPPVEPARVVRALPPRGPQHARRPAARRAGASSTSPTPTRPRRSTTTKVMVPAAYEARRQFLAAGDPLACGRDAARRRERRARRGGIAAERTPIADLVDAELAALPPSDERSLVECDAHLTRAMWALDVPHLEEAEREFALARDALARSTPSLRARTPTCLHLQGHRVLGGLTSPCCAAGSTRGCRRRSRSRARRARPVRVDRRDGVPQQRRARRAGDGLPRRPDRAGRGPALRRRDRAVVLPPRHGLDLRPRAVGRGPLGRGAGGCRDRAGGARRRCGAPCPRSMRSASWRSGRGELEQARELLERSLAAGLASGASHLVLPARWGLAEAALLGGDAERGARRCAAAAWSSPSRPGSGRCSCRSSSPARARRWPPAGRTMRSAGWTGSRRCSRTGRAQARPALDHADGLLRTSAGSTVAARQALEAAVAGWDALRPHLGGPVGAARPRRVPPPGEPRRGGRHAHPRRRRARRRARQPAARASAPTTCWRSRAAAAPRRSRGGR